MSTEAMLVILVAMVVGALVKGVAGTGLPTVAIPVMAGFIGVEEAVVVMAIPTVVTNSWLLWVHRAQARRARHLPVMIAAGGGGVALGAWLLTSVRGDVLALALAGLIGAYVGLSLTRPSFAFPIGVTRWAAPPVGFLGGVMQGATGIAGPAIATFVHGFRLPPGAYVFSLAAQFQVFATFSVIAFMWFGLYTPERVRSSLIALVPIMLVLPVGVWLGRRLNRLWFDRFVLVVLTLMGIKLVVDALTG